MTFKPLTLLLYERVLPGVQLLDRLADMGYRVQTVPRAGELAATAAREKPLLIIADFAPDAHAVGRAVSALKRDASTAHIPVIALVSAQNDAMQTAARDAGATLVVPDSVILQHLHQFVEQALALD